MGTANNVGNLLTQGANAQASGYVGGANAWGGALSGMGGNLTNLAMLSQMMPGMQSQVMAPSQPPQISNADLLAGIPGY